MKPKLSFSFVVLCPIGTRRAGRRPPLVIVPLPLDPADVRPDESREDRLRADLTHWLVEHVPVHHFTTVDAVYDDARHGWVCRLATRRTMPPGAWPTAFARTHLDEQLA